MSREELILQDTKRKHRSMKRVIWLFCLCVLAGACREEGGTVVRMETSLGNIRFRLYDETSGHRENMLKLVREGYYNGMLFHRVIRDFMIQTGDPDSKTARPGMLLGDGDAGYTIAAEILPRYFHRRGVVAAARESDNVNPERRSSGSHFYIVQGRVFAVDSLEQAVERINNNRYVALFNRLKAAREAEIMRGQAANDYESLMRINQELSEATREQFEHVKLRLSEEQVKAYTTVGGTPHLDGEYTVFGEVIEGLDVLDRIAGQETDEYARPVRDVVIEKMEIE